MGQAVALLFELAEEVEGAGGEEPQVSQCEHLYCSYIVSSCTIGLTLTPVISCLVSVFIVQCVNRK